MNNNKLDEASLLAGGKGVFAKASYISIGTKEYVARSPNLIDKHREVPC